MNDDSEPTTSARGPRDLARRDSARPGIAHQTIALVEPSHTLRESYRALVAEFAAAGEPPVPFTLAFEHDDFDALLVRLERHARGLDLPSGFVAHSSFWLVRDEVDVVGVANIRHALTDALRREGGNIGYGVRPSARGQGLGTEMLRQALPRAAALGLKRVLLTCAKENVASARVIAHNGGTLEAEEYIAARGEIVQRYWINIMDQHRG